MLAAVFQEHLGRFFEDKRSIILTPTETTEPTKVPSQGPAKSPTKIKQISRHEMGSFLDTSTEKPVRVQSQERISFVYNRNLLEIFTWYSHKFLATQNKDFDSLAQNLSNLSMQGFACFCQEFKVPLDNRAIAEVFKRSQVN
jgi:hypothetical protein